MTITANRIRVGDTVTSAGEAFRITGIRNPNYHQAFITFWFRREDNSIGRCDMMPEWVVTVA